MFFFHFIKTKDARRRGDKKKRMTNKCFDKLDMCGMAFKVPP